MVDGKNEDDTAQEAAEAVVASAEDSPMLPGLTAIGEVLSSAMESLIEHAANTLDVTGVSNKDKDAVMTALGGKKSELVKQLDETHAGVAAVASEADVAPLLEALAAEVAPMLAAEALNMVTAAERTNVQQTVAGEMTPSSIPAAEMMAVNPAAEMVPMQSAAEMMMARRAAAEAVAFSPAAEASGVTQNFLAAEPMSMMAAEAMGMLAAEASPRVVFLG